VIGATGVVTEDAVPTGGVLPPGFDDPQANDGDSPDAAESGEDTGSPPDGDAAAQGNDSSGVPWQRVAVWFAAIGGVVGVLILVGGIKRARSSGG
jgi:hypothetical protein